MVPITVYLPTFGDADYFTYDASAQVLTLHNGAIVRVCYGARNFMYTYVNGLSIVADVCEFDRIFANGFES